MTLPNQNKLLSNFIRCKNWEEKYIYIISLGKNLPKIPSNLRISKYLVPGCQSKIWVIAILNNNGIVDLYGDSDSLLMKGIISIIFILYHGLTPKRILNTDINNFIEQLNLNQNLTYTRSQGLGTIIYELKKQIKLIIKH